MSPSFKLTGGSSLIVLAIIEANSTKSSIFSSGHCKYSLWKLPRVALKFGRSDRVSFNDIKSLGLMLELLNLTAKRSISVILPRRLEIVILIWELAINSSTEFCLLVISAIFLTGWVNQDFNNLEPIGVLTLSIAHNKLPYFDLSLDVSINSKFLLVFASKDKYSEIEYGEITSNFGNWPFCVSKM